MRARTTSVLAVIVASAAIAIPGQAAHAAGTTITPWSPLQREGQTLFYESTASSPVATISGHTGVHKYDFDGDGIDDVVTTGESFGSGMQNTLDRALTGIVTVQYSHAGRTDYFVGSEDYEAQAGCCFGGSFAAGDFNHDGYIDLAIGASNEGIKSATQAIAGSGGVWVLYGSASGLRTDSSLTHFNEDSPNVPGGAEVNDHFGASIAAGDINGDGYADLAIGALGESIGTAVDAGAVTILYGRASGLSATGSVSLTQNSTGIPGTAETGDSFGSAIAIGNVNGDKYADIAIGSKDETDSSDAFGLYGSITLLRGASTGVATTGATDVTAAGAAEYGNGSNWVLPRELGSVLLIADTNGDGLGDIIAGSGGAQVGSNGGEGAVFWFQGRKTGLSATGRVVITEDTAGVAGASEFGDEFGNSLAAGDITGDGKADVLVGSSGEAIGTLTSAGAVYVIPGSSKGLTGTGSVSLTQGSAGVPGSAKKGDMFGSAVSVLNLNGTGGLDAVIGAANEASDGTDDAGTATALLASGGKLGSGKTWSGATMSTGDFSFIAYGEYGLGASSWSI
jgi:hypothetical protein